MLRKSGVFNFGKYKGLYVSDILADEPGYLIWLDENIDWLTIDPQLLKEANELYDATNEKDPAHVADATTDDWWNWK